jgi:hypothetical protein
MKQNPGDETKQKTRDERYNSPPLMTLIHSENTTFPFSYSRFLHLHQYSEPENDIAAAA